MSLQTINHLSRKHRLASIGLLVFAIVLMTGCADDAVESVFDAPAQQRSQQSINNLRDLLKSSEHGWTMSYKPDREKTGSYRFLFKFNKDSVVEMASDFSAQDLRMVKSSYTVLQGSTTKLSFSTFSPLHKLSDSNFSPIPEERGSGLRGDFEFLYYGTNTAGDLIFRTNRTQDTVIFQKANAGTLTDLGTAFGNQERLYREKSVYRALVESKNGVERRSPFTLPYDARVIRIRNVVAVNEGGVSTKELDNGYILGYAYTIKGILLDSVVLSDGRIVKNIEFTFDATENLFSATLSDGVKLSLGDVNGPPIPATGQKMLLDADLTNFITCRPADVDLQGTGLNSQAFISIFEKVRAFGGTRFDFIVPTPTSDGYISIAGTASVNNNAVIEFLEFQDKGDHMVIVRSNVFASPGNTIKPANVAAYDEFMNFLTDPDGFYVENVGRATRFTNQIFTLTSVKDPSIRFASYHIPR
jgi:hypothetical protein